MHLTFSSPPTSYISCHLPDLGLFFRIQHRCAISFFELGGVQKIIILQYYSHTCATYLLWLYLYNFSLRYQHFPVGRFLLFRSLLTFKIHGSPIHFRALVFAVLELLCTCLDRDSPDFPVIKLNRTCSPAHPVWNELILLSARWGHWKIPPMFQSRVAHP
jgi:hypothetical protein